MDNTPVTPATHHPYLCIELQSDLRWTTHIQNTANKAQKTLNILKRNIEQASTTVKSQAYKTIVRPQLEYASAIWDPHTTKDTYSLNKIQNYAARWVHRDNSHYTSVSSLQKQLNWPSLSDRRLQSRLVLFCEICHQNIAIPIPSYLQIPLRTTRHTLNINENSYRYRQLSTSTDTYKYSYFPPNNHRLEFTATQSVCDSNGAVLQGRPNPSSLPQPLIHTRTPLYITTDALSIHCK